MPADSITAAAHHVRTTHDRQALLAYISEVFEPYNDVPPSTIVDPDSYLMNLPGDLDERIKDMEVRLSHAEARALRSKLRYEEIRVGGLDALNSREIMHNGSGNPVMAIRAQMLVLHAHVTSDKVLIPRYRELLQTWREERYSAGHQIDFLF